MDHNSNLPHPPRPVSAISYPRKATEALLAGHMRAPLYGHHCVLAAASALLVRVGQEGGFKVGELIPAAVVVALEHAAREAAKLEELGGFIFSPDQFADVAKLIASRVYQETAHNRIVPASAMPAKFNGGN